MKILGIKYICAFVALIGIALAATAKGNDQPSLWLPSPPEPAPTKPLTEILWGKRVTDNYRYMESLAPTTRKWMTAQSTHTRTILDAIRPRAALEKKIAGLTSSLGLIQGYASYGERVFYLERAPDSSSFDLIVSDQTGKRKLIDVTRLNAKHKGAAYAINYVFASPDGDKVAAGISQGGSEAASLFVYDTQTGRQIAGPLDRADPGYVTWSENSKILYFPRLKTLAPHEPESERYRNPTLVSWDMKSDPVAILGSTAGHGPSFLQDELPTLTITPGASVALAVSFNGTQNEQAVWLSPASKVSDPKTRWMPFVAREDGITAVKAAGENLYLLSHKNSPTFHVLVVKANQPLSAAKILVKAEKDRVIDSIHTASDALYVLARRGSYSMLLRVPYTSEKAETIPLPFPGYVSEVFSDPRQAGITISLESYLVPAKIFTYDPMKRGFSDLKLGVSPHDYTGRYEIKELEAKANDGVMVPNTLVRKKGIEGARIVVVQAYGAYGISQLAEFSPRVLSFLEASGSYAWCHVRGGGEKGEAWRLDGKDANKPNTWRDLIACAEDLIARGVTTKEKLFIFSGSAGGITVGRAMTERPDLFAGVIAVAPGVNTLRQEFQPSGPLNIPEFGSITTKQGFENLYEMDTLQHVRLGVQYPATMITTGLNDPRVSPWEPAKFAAALQASGTRRPVLLRVESDAGHGFGSTKSQDDALYADLWSFVFWQAGLSEWQPTFSK